MKKRFLSMLCFLGCTLLGMAAGFPELTTKGDTTWYLIQFMNGGNAITAETPGVNVTTSAPTGADAQMWMVTGSKNLGYIFTNKLGYVLNVSAASKEQMVQASKGRSKQYRFSITSSSMYAGSYEIHPKANSGIAMNLWGGVNANQGVGLWDNGDANNAVKFLQMEEYEKMGRISIIPHPRELTVQDGELDMSSLTAIAYTGEAMFEHAQDLAAQLSQNAGISLSVKEAGAEPADGEIWFGQAADSMAAESYTLLVTDKRVEIRASEHSGWFYGLQTLKQIMPREYFGEELCADADWTLPCLSISDTPHLGYRGFMLDIARHFFGKDDVKRVLDIMSLYKMNRFHWHLTDDQGWRIEIPEYPKLTEVGSIRKASFCNPGDGQIFYDDTEYGRGMWYSLDDLREIVAYAKSRNIEIIPEVDLPGHMVAVLASYPELSCDSTRKYEVRVDGGIAHDVLNIGDDRTIDFLKCVLSHVSEVFPYKYVHIGGDECPTGQWASNQQCLDRVREEGLDGVHQLQSWLVEELGIFLKENYGKDLMVWDELLAHWNDNNQTKPVVMAWNALSKSSDAANHGLKSVIVPYQHLYLDFMQAPAEDRFVDEPYNGGWGDTWINSLDEIYALNPLSALSGREDFALGVQGNLWTETTNHIDEIEFQMLPRVLALSEIGWIPTEEKDWLSFLSRMQTHDEIFELKDYKYGKHWFTPTQYTPAEQAVREAESILEASTPGAVGFPEQSYYDALQKALEEGNTDSLNQAIANYKQAPIVEPQAGKTYQIISASTYYRRQYEGSTMYQKGDGVRFHYTPQIEPEELWQFIPHDVKGYYMKNLCSGKQLKMDAYNTAVQMVEGEGTRIRVDKATIATDDFTYIPGVVTISALAGYKVEMTGSVKRLSAECSGDVFAKDEAALCYNGTWRIVEVTDFSKHLQGLVKKCEIILITAKPGTMGNYTQEAIDFLQDQIIIPAEAAIQAGAVTEQTYNQFVDLYNQFLEMPKESISKILKENTYYYLRNVWFGHYAKYNASASNVQLSSSYSQTDNLLWRVKKHNDGTVYIYNKQTQTGAYLTSSGDGQQIKVGQDYAWTLEERTLDGKTGICIIDKTGQYSWYTNPGSWNYVLLKPFWGACTWEFVDSGVEVPVGITDVEGSVQTESIVYDLTGRRVQNPAKGGIYIVNGEKKVFE